jgi:nucleotide-binding universal stress UspA family protein
VEGQELKVEVQGCQGEDVARTLQQAAQWRNVDVLCMGTHGCSGLCNVLCEMMQRAEQPVLVVCLMK